MYDHTQIEPKWIKTWDKNKTFKVDVKKAKKPFYNLAMFPYPSGEGLHVGHIIPYSGVDTLGRFMRMRGFDVFEPMGFDAFGIHSENFAIKQGIHPKTLIAKTTQYFRDQQMKRLGTLFDWEREVNTTDPNYYKWTQWIFVQMFKHGLAEKRKAPVTYCPSCKTVLSDEQTEIAKQSQPQGLTDKTPGVEPSAPGVVSVTVCERCKTPIERRELEQWFFQITKYANKLLENLDHLNNDVWGKDQKIPEKDLKNGINWSEKTKRAQRNWIGKQEGIEIKFSIKYQESLASSDTGRASIKQDGITVFTKFPETIFGVTYIVLAPEHKLVSQLTTPEQKKAVEEYINQVKGKTEQERIAEGKTKTGVFTGSYVTNQVNGEKVPVWVADYVLATYGTGAVMGVPAHDERDFAFARKYGLPIKRVVLPKNSHKSFILKESVPSDFVETLKKNGYENISYDFNGNIQVEFNYDQFANSFIKLVAQALDAKYFVDVVGSNNIFVFKDKVMYFTDSHDEKKIIGEITRRWPDFAKNRTLFPLMGFQWGDEVAETTFYHDYLCFEENGILVNSKGFDGMQSQKDGREAIVEWMVKQGWAGRKTTFKLRDWCISRQRYWGPPIPMINCSKCGWQPVPEKDLPVVLPFVEDYQPTGDGKSPLAKDKAWMKVKCPKCQGWAERETDVSDTFLDSAWYFLRYPSVGLTDKEPWDRTVTKKWLPVDIYIGGNEHAVLHLMYARFITMALKDMDFIDFEEPFKKFFAHGLLIKEGVKMSKSRGNVVNPNIYLDKYGADTLRMYILFLGPYEAGGDFRDTAIAGTYRFLNRIWTLINNYPNLIITSKEVSQKLEAVKNKTVKKVTDDLSSLQFNTAIASLMEYYNFLSDVVTKELPNQPKQNKLALSCAEWDSAIKVLVLLLAPFAPFISEELWTQINKKSLQSVHDQPWPKYDESILKNQEVVIVVQVNGKVKDKITFSTQESRVQKEVEKAVMNSPKVRATLANKKIAKTIFVPGRLINLVT
ncbi:leucine--tRNA ligase [Candidatus Microgenomates bacterium]|nr:leucine--tRNA ligase [Candidatus Microgenomates bacterium]